MKVLWFANTPCGGAEIINKKIISGGWLISLERELVKRDNLNLSICFYSECLLEPFFNEGTMYYPIYRKYSGSKLWRYFSRVFGFINDKHEIEQLLSIINIVQPDIIHVHGTEENFGLVQLYTNIPVLLSIQGILSAIDLKFFAGIPKNIAAYYEPIKSKLLFKSASNQKKSYRLKVLREQKILAVTKYVMGRTDWDRRVTRVLAPDSKYYIGNEILRLSFYENKWDKHKFENILKIITVLGNGIYKGLETLIQIVQILDKNKNLKFEWTLVGLRRDDDIVLLIEKWLHIEIDSMPIHFVGSKSENEVVQFLLASDIYCQLSHIENSPNSLSEAMLLGMPVIATMAGGTASLLKDKHEGLLVQEGEPYSYAGAICEMASNFSLSNNYAQAARSAAYKRHNKIEIVDNVQSIYKLILRDSEKYS